MQGQSKGIMWKQSGSFGMLSINIRFQHCKAKQQTKQAVVITEQDVTSVKALSLESTVVRNSKHLKDEYHIWFYSEYKQHSR